MDALDLLEQQHLDVRALIDRIAIEPSPGRKTAMVAELSRMIDAHVRIEETYLYPVCAERMRGDRSQLHEAYEKHELTRFAADNLLRTRATDVRFEARLKLLRDLFSHHAGEEEDWMFQKAKRDLTDEQLDALGCSLARAYELLLQINVPFSARSTAPRAPRRAIARAGRTKTRVHPARLRGSVRISGARARA